MATERKEQPLIDKLSSEEAKSLPTTPIEPAPPFRVHDSAQQEQTVSIPQPSTLSGSESDKIFKEIGKILQEQRERISLPLDEVENMIKVRLRYLQALENGQISDLPSPVQGRGMLNNYARLLNLDADKMLLRFAEGLQAQRGERVSRSTRGQAATRLKPPAKPPTLLGRLITADLIIVGLVILFLFGFAIWSSAQVTSLQTTRKSTYPPSISEILIAASTQTAIPGGALLPPTSQASVLLEPTRSTRLTGNPGETPALAAPLDSALLQVYVLARQRTWLQVTSDKKMVFNGRILPGSSYPFSASERIELVAGNAAAIQVLFNQKDMGTLGLSGQVVNLVFTKDGMRNPTPTITPTPTRTIPATPTISPTPNPLLKTATVTPFIP